MATGRIARKLDNALSLRDFLHRSKVLTQYRNFMRELRGIDETASKELRARIREGFKANKAEKDKANRAAMLLEGTRQLQFVRTYVGTAKRGEAVAGAEGESWVGSGGDPEDVKGRLGHGWPWAGAEAADAEQEAEQAGQQGQQGVAKGGQGR